MKTREWLYIIFIVILLQFIVQASAWIYGGNSGALGYISFAGTIVSIILAILAIVYSYVQSISQQSSSEKISNQVDKLIGITDKIDLSKQGLSETIVNLNNISSKIDKTIDHQGVINEKVDGLAENLSRVNLNKIDELFSHATKSKEFAIRSKASGDFYSKPLSTGYGGITFACLYLYYAEKMELTLDKVVDELIMVVLEGIIDNFENYDNFKGYQEGFFLGAWQTLSSNEYLYVIDDDEGMLFSLHNDFKSECEDFVHLYKQSKEDEELDSQDEVVLNIINICESILEKKR
jgi:hypothetical protein